MTFGQTYEVTSRLQIQISEPGDEPFKTILIVDDSPFGVGACLDPGQLRDSALGSGSFDLLTCGCGIPGCAGIFEPVFVAHRANAMIWECSDEFYPFVRDVDPAEGRTLRYVFDRSQYVDSVRTLFQRLRSHPDARADKSWYHGFDSSIFDQPFPTAYEPLTPFPEGSTLVVGLIGEYRQPWVWVEGFEDAGPGHLLPTRSMSLRFGRWSSMFGEGAAFLGRCVWRADSAAYGLAEGVTPAQATSEGEALARELESFWGVKARLDLGSNS